MGGAQARVCGARGGAGGACGADQRDSIVVN
jgi:hypothetical protein